MKRIVFTAAFGNPRYAEMALGLGRSLKLIGDLNPRVIVTDIEDFPFAEVFDEVVRVSVRPEEMWWVKASAFNYVQGDAALFIDADCLAFKRLDPVFDCFAGHCFGVQGTWKTSGEWYGKEIAEVCASENVERLPMFNAGMLYYENCGDYFALRAAAQAIAKRGDQIGWRRARGQHSEEVCLSLAMAKLGLGKLEPESASFHNSAVGLVGKLRMDVMRGECSFVCRRHDLEFVDPFVFHAHFYGKFLTYWRQIARLEKLAEIEKRTNPDFIRRGLLARRCVDRFLLKLLGRN